jgi:hypothetical protein
LFYESAHLWTRAPFTVPVVLVVREEFADLASAILKGDSELAAERLALIKDCAVSDSGPRELRHVRPWELLALAFYCLLPAFCFAEMPYPPFVPHARRIGTASVDIAHFIGWTGIGFSLLLIAAFVFAFSARDKN